MSLIAMATAEGGYVVVGIHDGAVDGVPPERINGLRQTALDFTSPVVRSSVNELQTAEGHTVLVFSHVKDSSLAQAGYSSPNVPNRSFRARWFACFIMRKLSEGPVHA